MGSQGKTVCLHRKLHGIALLGLVLCIVDDTAKGLNLGDQLDVTVAVVKGGESFISISSTNVAWTNVVIPGVMDRINSPKLTCNFFPAAGPWQIRLFHRNTVSMLPLQRVGSTSATNSLLVRVWQPNFGPTNYYALGTMPDPMDPNVWTKGTIVGPEIFPGHFARQASSDYPPIDFNFMINARNVPEATYEGTIYFELQTP
jgi:hypothetical protein